MLLNANGTNMKLSYLKTVLPTLSEVRFSLPNGKEVPAHFHVTEVGSVTKHFIDCGGTERTEQVVNFQLWEANDTDHRLQPEKLLRIISQCEIALHLPDLDIEVEYQAETIGRYDLSFDGETFRLLPKQTACLASDHCGIPHEKMKKSLASLTTEKSGCCTPGSGCC